ncbi:hypothetical protein Megpolyxen_02006 (plasmid) [Candidatus Megaera polyxenophila]|nr:hypothetical protein Megpolyxen_02006 [Candidatus Megaera polyxenophila]
MFAVKNPMDFATSFKFNKFSTYVENHKLAQKKNVKDEFYRQSKIANLVSYDSDNDTTPTIKKSWEEIDFKQINPILKNILISGQFPNKTSIGNIEKTKEIISLLFISETSRNPATFLTSLMFLELLAANELTIEDNINAFPMHLKRAVNASRELNDSYYNNFRFKYDYSKGEIKLSEDLKECENELFIKWLEFKDIQIYSGKSKNKKWNDKEINNALNELINDWYDIDLKGLEEYGKIKPIDYIDPYFGKYTLDALDNVLHLRINDLKLKEVKILQSIFINQDYNNISDTLIQILAFTVKTTLVPLNLFNKHAVGLIFERNENGVIKVKYLDSLNKHIPQELKQLITHILGSQVDFHEIPVEEQKYANCGPEVVENFILYLTGNRVSQEKAIELHSKLVENSLLDLTIPNTCLLFEQSNYDEFQPDICLSGNYNEEVH